ncbi:hypothetical protein NPX13_g8271 [Xylaria arbuscula]|uniref:Uncharacterized protein n=1 Tax=Xylaria arbuscula TaxID=114810 RepID=A0A9W8TJL3_9PEZI|nr:hypothetical protein NPX13_g8271 [Xylaria arbuscula]
MYGISGLQAHIRKHVKFAEDFADMLRTRPDLFEIVTGPRYALTVFKLKHKSETATVQEVNALTKKSYDGVVTEGKLFLSSTVVGGVFAIRHNPATPFVEAHHVKKHFEILAAAAEKALAEA